VFDKNVMMMGAVRFLLAVGGWWWRGAAWFGVGLSRGCRWGAVLSPGMTDIVEENYQKLSALLRGREDWRPVEQYGERLWCFGVDGEARLVVTAEMDGFLMYRADRDESWVIPRIESVGAWLEGNEAEHAGLSPVREAWKAAYLEELERAQKRPDGDNAL
jgi:hypothetical protein